MQIDAEQAIKELVAKGIKLPPQPKVLIALQKMLKSDDFSIKDLARIISGDPGIVSMLFKTARSPVFSSGKELTTVEQVLMVIGIKQTYNLVQAISLSSSLSGASSKAFDIFWTRSQEIANIAALIAADRVSVCNIFPDQAYMAGIFHECGVPVLMLRFPDYCSKLRLDTTSYWPELSEQDAKFHVDHSSIGYLIARHWKLPDFICNSILYHHELPREESGAVRSLVAILQLAIHFHHRIYQSEHLLWERIGDDVMAELGFHPDDEHEYYEEISEQFTELS